MRLDVMLAYALLAGLLVLPLQLRAQQAGVSAQMLAAGATPLLARDGPDATTFRGSLVFMNYCVTCHGANADGKGRAARLHRPAPANLRSSDKGEAYMKLIAYLQSINSSRS